jgi:hypothetical protein
MGLEGRLTLLVFLNFLKVHVEQVRGIERASLGFRVELSGEDRSRSVDETCTVLDIGIIIRDLVQWVPSLLLSFRFRKYGFQSEGNVEASTAYPWF